MLLSIFSIMLIAGKYKYFLIMLIILELVIINLGAYLFYVFGIINLEIIFVYFLVFGVCESVIGLIVLTLIIRFRGNDYYKVFRILKFNYDKVFYVNCFCD